MAVLVAYLGGAVVGAVGLLSAASILGRTALDRPILGDYELVEVGIAVAGSLFLPYCQATRGHIIVDFFTLRAGPRIVAGLDRAGALLMGAMFLAVGWRTLAGCVDIAATGETTMLMRLPVWIGYAAMVPGVLLAALIALVQAAGAPPAEPAARD